ncbi:MAG: S-methyl-5-thioribose-1-phosphate isomerase [Betaproteobacteria bacterium]|nr:S-methyl-5-thioribose-1-phosphate isomerase [Betaproteobacteria bacterium]
MTLNPLIPGSGSIRILDQCLLPYAETWREIDTLEACARAIETMQVRGAPLIGVTAAFGVALAMRANASDTALAEAVARLARTRPTAVNLHWALARMREKLAAAPASERAAIAWREALAIHADDIAANAAIGRHGLALIAEQAARKPGPVRIMTHCNAGALATSGWGTALAPVYAAHAAGIPVSLWVSETRPRNQGLLSAWELSREGVPNTLIADNAAGHLMQRGEVDMLIVGADRIAQNGDTANKIGTYLKALAAAAHKIPFYVAAPTSTFDAACADGGGIPIENRSAAEVQRLSGLNELQQKTEVCIFAGHCANPAFDVTPAALITAILTERGSVAPANIATLLDS